MTDSEIITVSVAALDRYIEHLEAAMKPGGEVAGVLETRDLFAISGLQSQDFVLHSVAEIVRRVSGWQDSRLGALSRPALQQAAASLARSLEAALCA